MKKIDLNLLNVLDALLATGSVTAAAERLHLSVPATSHALARLREATGDPLLVRAGRRLVPTPRAQALREPVAQWLGQVQALLQPPPEADLSGLEREFVVRAPDAMAIAFGPGLAAALMRDMPRARLHFLPEAWDDAAALREGRIDLDIGPFRPTEPELRLSELFPVRQAAVVRRDHPLAAGELTAERYAEAPHVAVRPRARMRSAVDEALAALGLRRRIVVTVAHANVAPLIAAGSGLVATISERMALAMAASQRLAVLPLPFLPEPETLVMVWHPRFDADPAHTWLRTRLPRLIQAGRVGAAPPGPDVPDLPDVPDAAPAA